MLSDLLFNNHSFNITARIFSVVFIIGSVNYGADEFYVFNVGQGNCNLFIPHCKDSGVILYDAGWSAKPYDKDLNKKDVTSSTDFAIADDITDIIANVLKNKTKKHLEVVVSHSDEDHLNLLKEIVKDVQKKIDKLVVVFNFGGTKEHYQTKGKQAAKDLVKWVDSAKFSKFFAGGQHVFPKKYNLGLNKSFTEHILSWKTTEDPNVNSIILQISPVSNDYSILLTGDGEKDTFESIDEDNVRDTTVMVASHHGADTKGSNSAEWIQKVNPKHVVFSSCYNGAHHHPPVHSVVKRYLETDSLETTELHVLSIYSDSNQFIHDQLRYLGKIKIGIHDYSFYLTKKGIYHTLSFGTVKFSFETQGVKITSPTGFPKVGMFPKTLGDTLTTLDLSKFGLTNVDITSSLSLNWGSLKSLTSLDISKNKIDLKVDEVRKAIAKFIKKIKLKTYYIEPQIKWYERKGDDLILDYHGV